MDHHGLMKVSLVKFINYFLLAKGNIIKIAVYMVAY